KPLDINGSFMVSSQQTNLTYSVQSSNSSYTYTWSVPSNAKIKSGQHTSSITVNWGSTAGNVTVNAQNNCGSSADRSKMVKISKSLNAYAITLPQAGKEEMLLMPNPVKDIATLQFYAKTNYAYTIQITDVRGRSLLQKKGAATTGTNTKKFNVQNLSAGTYFILFTKSTGEKQTLEMIKE
ncbi:MAG: T9SS type A sorting domain-containing protein, partial [Parafilimonas sp.]